MAWCGVDGADGADGVGGAEDTNDTGRKRKVGKKGRPMSEAAIAKAHREKARRERLNGK